MLTEPGHWYLPSSPSGHSVGSLSPGDTSQAGINATVECCEWEKRNVPWIFCFPCLQITLMSFWGKLEILSVLMQIIAQCIPFVSNITEKDDLMHVLSVTLQYLLPLVEIMVFHRLYFRQIHVPDMNNLSQQCCVARAQSISRRIFLHSLFFCFVLFLVL